jgi:glucokinase
MLLAGDVGGTKTLIGLFTPGEGRPTAVDVRSYRTLDFVSLTTLCREFLHDAAADARKIRSACFGVAGPIQGRRAQLTNVPWEVDADAICRDLDVPNATLLNDLEAMAWAVPVLRSDELTVLREGAGRSGSRGGAALIAAGTGLGIALLPRVDGQLVAQPSEGGHVDFAARTPEEQALQSALIREYGRAELEQVLSGPGLVNIHRFLYPHQCRTLSQPHEAGDFAARISQAALEAGCPQCRKTLEVFVSVYGASAGDLALVTLATSGVYLGGGIAPRILPALRWPMFEDAFCAKAPLEALMRRIPVSVILNPGAGIIGAATFSNRQLGLEQQLGPDRVEQ